MSSSSSAMQAYLRDPDVQLMLRAKDGDEAAFTQLVLSYQDRLIAVFSHLLGDQDAAEDLVQDVFLRVYRARNGYQPTAKFSTWLFRIANNLAKQFPAGPGPSEGGAAPFDRHGRAGSESRMPGRSPTIGADAVAAAPEIGALRRRPRGAPGPQRAAADGGAAQ